MKTLALLGTLSAVLASLGVQAEPVGGPTSQAPMSQEELTRIVTGLDTAFFDSFNHCDVPAQFAKHASLLDPKFEFYHDNGGVTWTSKDYLDTTRKNVCGHFRRVLMPGTLRIYPIAHFGAIEEGQHSFCDITTDKCFGTAKFMFVWQMTVDGWRATRAFSYGHRAL